MYTLGVPQEPGRPSHLHADSAWYRRAKAAELGGMVERESEYLIVPVKQGNPPQGTLWREGGTELRDCWRERWRERRVPQPSQRNFSR
jgi:hypothetical protein